MDLRELQSQLKLQGLYSMAADGVHGIKTDEAIEALFLKERVKDYDTWSDARREIAAEQLLCRMAGIEVGDIDGRIGPQTRFAFEVYEARKANGGKPVPSVEQWRDTADLLPAPAPSHALPPAPKTIIGAPKSKPAWPRQSGVEAFFGAVGTRQTTLILPFPMRLAWETETVVRKWSCHEKCKEHFERIWVRTLEHYGIDEIIRLRLHLWGGTLNVRKMRGGSSWSMHSWGIAEDVDPDHNQLKWGADKASLDDKPYDPFWGFVYDEGAIGLGRERNMDFMHLQFARL